MHEALGSIPAPKKKRPKKIVQGIELKGKNTTQC
jgi:hypothetical protein